MRLKSMALLFATGLVLAVVGCGDDPKAINEACQSNGDCEGGVCHAGVCASTTPLDNGKACTGNGECKSFNCENGKCAAGKAKEGADCLNKLECASTSCEAKKCTLKALSSACATDAQCKSGICNAKTCVKSCTKPADCDKGQVCSGDGKKQFCTKPKYNTQIGKSCAISGTCPSGLKCLGAKNDPGTVCTAECKSDVDCPPDRACEEIAKKFYCMKRRFCSTCTYDAQCGTEGKCVSFGGGKHCTKACNKGSTECSLFAECKDTGGGKYHCVHKAGKCKGTGKLCDPCTKKSDCAKGGMCLTFNMSQESFCGTDCTSSQTCSSGYTCYKVSAAGDRQCGPKGATGSYPKCVSLLSSTANVGDVVEDYAAVGFRDSDGDNDLTDEKLKIIKLSDIKDKKIILFNISAFW